MSDVFDRGFVTEISTVLGGSQSPALAGIFIPTFATASLPTTNAKGQLVFDSTTNKLKVWTGAAFETVTSS